MKNKRGSIRNPLISSISPPFHSCRYTPMIALDTDPKTCPRTELGVSDCCRGVGQGCPSKACRNFAIWAPKQSPQHVMGPNQKINGPQNELCWGCSLDLSGAKGRIHPLPCPNKVSYLVGVVMASQHRPNSDIEDTNDILGGGRWKFSLSATGVDIPWSQCSWPKK